MRENCVCVRCLPLLCHHQEEGKPRKRTAKCGERQQEDVCSNMHACVQNVSRRCYRAAYFCCSQHHHQQTAGGRERERERADYSLRRGENRKQVKMEKEKGSGHHYKSEKREKET